MLQMEIMLVAVVFGENTSTVRGVSTYGTKISKRIVDWVPLSTVFGPLIVT